MKKVLLSIITTLLVLIEGCSNNGGINEFENNFGEIIYNGKDISGVWTIVGDMIGSDMLAYKVEQLLILDGETISNHYPLDNNIYGFVDQYLYGCTLDDFVLKEQATFHIVGDKLYISGDYFADLELSDDNTLLLIFDEGKKLVDLKKAKGFKEHKGSGKKDSKGLPIPLDNEIYYRTLNSVKLNIQSPGILTHTYNVQENYGRIVWLDTVEAITGFHNSEITSINIPDRVTSIGKNTFYKCFNLANICIGKGVISIGDYAFYSCVSLDNINIPDGVSYIGECAFNGCSNLTNITLGKGVTSIGERAFLGCVHLDNINIPDGVLSIEKSAFNGCSNLTSITLGKGVTSIGEKAFCYCSNLARITIPYKIISIEADAFYGCNNLNTYVDIDNFARYCQVNTTYRFPGIKHLLIDGEEIDELEIPDGVDFIGDNAFKGCSSLSCVNIPYSVAEIGAGAFSGCTGELKLNSSVVSMNYTSNDYPSRNGWLNGSQFSSIVVGNSVTSIGNRVFSDCMSLKNVTIGIGVTSIGYYAFSGCSGLMSVTIPDSVTTIGSDAFQNCTSLTSVYCKPTTPPTGGSFMFDNNTSGRKIYVPRASVDAYKNAKGWSNYADDIVGYDF